MRTSFWFKTMYFVLSILMGAATLSASTPAPCQSGKPTTGTPNWDFPKEASQILSQIRVDSFKIRDSAAQLEAYDGEAYLVGWQAESDLLSQLRHQVNQMDSNICRLRTIESMTTAEQQEAITRILPQMVVVTDETQLAIHFLDNNHSYLWAPPYREYAVAMYNSANLIYHDLQNRGLEHTATGHQTPKTSKS
jgi:hypothetical protein